MAQDTVGHRVLNIMMLIVGVVAIVFSVWAVGRAALWIETNGGVIGRWMIGVGLIGAVGAYIAGIGAAALVCGAATMILGACVWALGL